MKKMLLGLGLLTWAACSSHGDVVTYDANPSHDVPVDAGPDAAPPDAPVDAVVDLGDVPATACTSDRDCSETGRVCDRGRGLCVECLTATDCGGGGQTCTANRCVAQVPCMSSRMCPGQVCDTAHGYCVDCLTDVDCTGGTVCRGSVCVPPPRECRSSRQCSDLNMVCDTTRGYCVECVTDVDCPMGQYCTVEAVCRAQTCTPGTHDCVDATHARTCDPRGAAWIDQPCASMQTCATGVCTPWTCTPGAATCASLTARSVCNPDGLGTTMASCGAGESCAGGVCRARICAPGSATCTGPALRHVCDDDGLAYTDRACPAGQGCAMGVCTPWTCTPGARDCPTATTQRECSPDGQGYAVTACGTRQSCAGGLCRSWTCTPGVSSCATSTTMSVCNDDGLGYHVVACASMQTCSGTACTGWACTPFEVACASSTSQQTCRSDGLGWQPAVPCPLPTRAASASCSLGACSFTCNAGWGNCDGNASNGCETDLANASYHCGACGHACPGAANATPACTASACGLRCVTGYADCNGNAADGCEASLSSLATCGACGRACTAPSNGTATCDGTACGVRCNTGYNLCRGINTCAANVTTETCDGSDNDCDGTVDEGCGTGTCSSPYVAAAGGGSYHGTMNGYSTQSASCGAAYNSGGVDRIYRWTPARSGTATIRLTGDFWPATLYVRQGTCATGTQVACQSNTSTWPTETVSFAVTAGTAYYVIVDCHYNGTTYTVTYDLTITSP